MASPFVFHRPDLAKRMADVTLGLDPLGGSSGLFLAAPRRTGKSTFLTVDLVPELRRRGAVPVFSVTHCKACPLKARCTRSNRRVLAPRRREEHETFVAARAAARDPVFFAEQKRRAGIERPLSKGVRTNGLRRGLSSGAAKSHLQYVLTAAAISLSRIAG